MAGVRKVAALISLALASLLGLAACGSASTPGRSGTPAGEEAAAGANPDLDPGSSLGGVRAPDLRLTNQFGQPMSLGQFRGKVIILAFVDSRCTTVCPLTTVSMVQARQMLGTAGDNVQLLGIDANPAATSVADVMSYSRAHGMVNQWDFLTGSLAQLKVAWKAFSVYVQIEKGQVDHTPALFVIDQRGRERKVYLTTMSYASIGQEAQVLAQETASLLPGHPKPASEQSLAYIRGLGPAVRERLPAVPSGSVTLGPGQPRLILFFATWLTETSDLQAQMLALNNYAKASRNGRLPALTAVDEAVTEASPGAAAAFLRHLGHPPAYPVGLDLTGRLADGYGVQDQPWFALTNAHGKIVWKHDGWLPVSALERDVRAAVSPSG
jgi:cytochrome oxidase Cu insertion factor (SCO1/SenC/PrrC family)